MWKVVASVVTSLAVAVMPAAATTTTSGIKGTVIRGPTMPVCRQGVACSAPAAGYALVFLRGGVRIATATTTEAGIFRVTLKPGTYIVRSLRRSTFGALPPHAVRVLPGRFTVANFEIDTGIR